VIEAIYDEAVKFEGGLAMVELDGKIGYIDYSENYIYKLST